MKNRNLSQFNRLMYCTLRVIFCDCGKNQETWENFEKSFRFFNRVPMEKLNFCHFLHKMYLNLVALGDNIIFLRQFFWFRGVDVPPVPPAGVHVLVLPIGSADDVRGLSILKHSRYDRRSSLKAATFDGILRIRINCSELTRRIGVQRNYNGCNKGKIR